MKKAMCILLLLIITSGCGNTKPNTQTEEPSDKPVNGDTHQGIIAGKVESTIQTKQENNSVKITFKLKNQTERPVTYNFNTSQRIDYQIKDTDGNVVYKYSASRSFLQVLGKFTLKQGEEKEFVSTVDNLKPGNYTVTIWLTANEQEQPKATQSFEVK